MFHWFHYLLPEFLHLAKQIQTSGQLTERYLEFGGPYATLLYEASRKSIVETLVPNKTREFVAQKKWSYNMYIQFNS